VASRSSPSSFSFCGLSISSIHPGSANIGPVRRVLIVKYGVNVFNRYLISRRLSVRASQFLLLSLLPCCLDRAQLFYTILLSLSSRIFFQLNPFSLTHRSFLRVRARQAQQGKPAWKASLTHPRTCCRRKERSFWRRSVSWLTSIHLVVIVSMPWSYSSQTYSPPFSCYCPSARLTPVALTLSAFPIRQSKGLAWQDGLGGLCGVHLGQT
jgi:hypothetical protein